MKWNVQVWADHFLMDIWVAIRMWHCFSGLHCEFVWFAFAINCCVILLKCCCFLISINKTQQMPLIPFKRICAISIAIHVQSDAYIVYNVLLWPLTKWNEQFIYYYTLCIWKFIQQTDLIYLFIVEVLRCDSLCFCIQ